MALSVEGQILKILWGRGAQAGNWTRTDYATAILAIPEIEEALKLLEKADRQVELDEDQTHPDIYFRTSRLQSTLTQSPTNTVSLAIPKGVAQAYEQAGFQRVKSQGQRRLIMGCANCGTANVWVNEGEVRCLACNPLASGESR